MEVTVKMYPEEYDLFREYKTSYIWGGLGSPITDASLTRAANAYAKNTERGWIDAARRYAGNHKAFYFDCVGLIKAILWGWSGDSARTYGGATYPTMNQVLAGACPDISADGKPRDCHSTADRKAHRVKGRGSNPPRPCIVT